MQMQRQERLKPAWTTRREEYLRALGRRADLIREGFEPEADTTPWLVVEGGRKGVRPRHDRSFNLFVVRSRTR